TLNGQPDPPPTVPCPGPIVPVPLPGPVPVLSGQPDPPTAPPTPDPPGTQITLDETSGPGDAGSPSTVTLALADNHSDATRTVTTQRGVARYSGLTLEKLRGGGFRLVAPTGGPNAVHKPRRDVASSRTILTERVLTAGRGTHKH